MQRCYMKRLAGCAARVGKGAFRLDYVIEAAQAFRLRGRLESARHTSAR
jgi:hypothetical protein